MASCLMYSRKKTTMFGKRGLIIEEEMMPLSYLEGINLSLMVGHFFSRGDLFSRLTGRGMMIDLYRGQRGLDISQYNNIQGEVRK